MASLSRPVPFRNHSATKSAAPQKSSSQCRKLYTANAFRMQRFSNRKNRQLQVYGSSRVEEATSSGEGGDSIVGAVEEDDLIERLSAAVQRRVSSGLLTRCATESTTAFRLLHGATEGAPGFTVDVYGERVLVQCWRDGLDELEQAAVTDACRRLLPAVADVQFHLRGRAAKKTGRTTKGEENDRNTFTELGLSYHWEELRNGGDPSLFLDFRPVRRLLRRESAGKDVLNLFAYTCGAGVAALAGGARSVCNVDHSAAYMSVGRRNAALNRELWEGEGDEKPVVEYIAQDFYTAARQMAGLGVKGRASRGKRNATFPKLPVRAFDIVVLDPPTLTKSSFGAVDIVNDYASLAKPALLCTRPGGGLLVATNHTPNADAQEWLDSVVRCGKKCGRPIAEASLLEIEADDDDFPPSEEKPRLLKVGLFRTA